MLGWLLIKLLLVDDHDLVRTAIARMLSDISDLQVLGQASSGEQAYSMLADLEPHVVLMDIRMPGIGGLEATRKIKQRFPQVKVLALSAYADDPFPTRLLQAGASGYLTKGSCIEETVRAIRLVAAGKHYLSPDIAQQMALKSFDNNQHNCPFEQLSDREMQVSLMIANGQRFSQFLTCCAYHQKQSTPIATGFLISSTLKMTWSWHYSPYATILLKTPTHKPTNDQPTF